MNKIHVTDYGDMLAKIKGKKLISYATFGSYSGDWIAALDAGDTVELWKGYYGSCSGCDWLCANKEYDDDFNSIVSKKDAKEFFREHVPFLTLEKSLLINLTTKDFSSLLPKNTRSEIYDFKPGRLLKDIVSSLKKVTKDEN